MKITFRDEAIFNMSGRLNIQIFITVEYGDQKSTHAI
jgi:hypothetical protein